MSDIVKRTGWTVGETTVAEETVVRRCEHALQLLEMSPTQQHALEFQTRQQRLSKKWYDHRCGRLIASNFGAVIKCVQPLEGLVQRFLPQEEEHSYSSGSSIPSLKWDCDNEPLACQAYVEHEQRKGGRLL